MEYFTTTSPSAMNPVADFFFVKSGSLVHRVAVGDIQFITSDRNYCEIQLPEKRLLVRASLTKLLALFAPGIFFPVGRNAAVRAGAIDYLDLETGLLHVGSNTLPFNWRRLKSDIFEQHCLLK